MPSWTLNRDHIEDLAEGCALLGSGGGGDPYSFRLILQALIARQGAVPVIDADELPPDSIVVNVGYVGAPLVMTEKLFTESEVTGCLKAMNRRIGRPIAAVMPTEIGGANGLAAFIASALLRVPVVDADGMGRAFPMGHQTSYSIYGRMASPTVVATEHGDVICVESPDNRRIEDLVRALSVVAGHKCFSADYPLTGDEVRATAVLGTTSLARRIGAALRVARTSHAPDPSTALKAISVGGGRLQVRRLFSGKVVACVSETRHGWTVGRVNLESIPVGTPLTLEFQNEFLIARQETKLLATTPDIISVLDSDTFRPISSDAIRYGQRVCVLGIGAPEILRSQEALRVVGPRAFGFEFDYHEAGKEE